MLNIFTLKISFPTCSDYCQTSFIWYVLKAFFFLFSPPHLSFSLKIHYIFCICCFATPVFWTLSRFFCNSHPGAVLWNNLWVLHYWFEATGLVRVWTELSCSMLCVETHLSVLKGTFLIAECWNETLTFISAPKGRGFTWVSKDQTPIPFARACFKVCFNSWWFHWKIKLTHIYQTTLLTLEDPHPFLNSLRNEKANSNLAAKPCTFWMQASAKSCVLYCYWFFFLSSVYTFNCPY